MITQFIIRKNVKSTQSTFLLVVLISYIFLSLADSRKHNSYRRFYKKSSTPTQFPVTPRPDFYGSQNIYTTVSPPYGSYSQSHSWPSSYDSSRNRKVKITKSNRNKYVTDRQSHYGHEMKASHYGHEMKAPEYGHELKAEYGHELKAVEKDDTLDGLTGVIGPLIFPIPFLLAVLPFAIPAIPIALLLPFGNSSESAGDIAEGKISQSYPEFKLTFGNNDTQIIETEV